MTDTIYTIGGGQIYVRNKTRYLEANGWDVIVISSIDDGNLMIPDLQRFEKYVLSQLQFSYFFYSAKVRGNILEKIKSYIGNYNNIEEIVVESHSLILACWGEIVSKQIRAKHLVFLLAEKMSINSENLFKFLEFKNSQNLLYGITPESIKNFFKPYKEIGVLESKSLRAVCQAEVMEISNFELDTLKMQDINIGCISRLQKPYVMVMIDDIVEFANRFPQKSIQLIMVGGSPIQETIDGIVNKVKNVNNINLIFLGRLFPLPQKLFKVVDLFIGVAGSIRISAIQGVPSAVINIDTNKVDGILGFDVEKTLFNENSPNIKLSEFLEFLFIDGEIHRYRSNIRPIEPIEFSTEYENHMVPLKENSNCYCYYSFDSSSMSKSEFLKIIIFRLIGKNSFKKLIANKFLFNMYKSLKCTSRRVWFQDQTR